MMSMPLGSEARRAWQRWRARSALTAVVRAGLVFAAFVNELGSLGGWRSARGNRKVRLVVPRSIGPKLDERPWRSGRALAKFGYAGAVYGSLASIDEGGVYWFPDEAWRQDGVPDVLLLARTIVDVEHQMCWFGRRRVVRFETGEGEVWFSGSARHALLSEVATASR